MRKTAINGVTVTNGATMKSAAKLTGEVKITSIMKVMRRAMMGIEATKSTVATIPARKISTRMRMTMRTKGSAIATSIGACV